MTLQEINAVVERAEVPYLLLLIAFLLSYIAFYRNQSNQPLNKK
ncbi:MAG TPA: hypothetical protein VJC05_04250 [Candidatus Andersenbacteria bacterium]|nr:hypothetical protein [Candidatus Andersenbacteria bacterium]